MALRKPQAVTSMEEIRARKGMPFDEFCEKHPYWEWTESRMSRNMVDAEGRVWVPMWNAEHGVPIGRPRDLTPEADEFLSELSRKALEDSRAGRMWTLDEIDAMEESDS